VCVRVFFSPTPNKKSYFVFDVVWIKKKKENGGGGGG